MPAVYVVSETAVLKGDTLSFTPSEAGVQRVFTLVKGEGVWKSKNKRNTSLVYVGSELMLGIV